MHLAFKTVILKSNLCEKKFVNEQCPGKKNIIIKQCPGSK